MQKFTGHRIIHLHKKQSLKMLLIYKNDKYYCSRETLDDAEWELECIARYQRSTGAMVIKHTNDTLIIDDNDTEIIYKIIEK